MDLLKNLQENNKVRFVCYKEILAAKCKMNWREMRLEGERKIRRLLE